MSEVRSEPYVIDQRIARSLLASAIKDIEVAQDAAPTRGGDDGLAALYNLRDLFDGKYIGAANEPAK